MNSKKIIEKLFKIAVKQQEIITKLAQAYPVAPDMDPYASPTNPEADRKLLQSWVDVAAINLNLGQDHQQKVILTPENLFVISAAKLGNKQEQFKNNIFNTIVANKRGDLSSKITFKLS